MAKSIEAWDRSMKPLYSDKHTRTYAQQGRSAPRKGSAHTCKKMEKSLLHRNAADCGCTGWCTSLRIVVKRRAACVVKHKPSLLPGLDANHCKKGRKEERKKGRKEGSKKGRRKKNTRKTRGGSLFEEWVACASIQVAAVTIGTLRVQIGQAKQGHTHIQASPDSQLLLFAPLPLVANCNAVQ